MVIEPVETNTYVLDNVLGEGEFIELQSLLHTESCPNENACVNVLRAEEENSVSPTFERTEEQSIEIEVAEKFTFLVHMVINIYNFFREFQILCLQMKTLIFV